MTYEEECHLKAQYLIAAASGVEFEHKNRNGTWSACPRPVFNEHVVMYRRKPTIVRHERVISWYMNKTQGPFITYYQNDTEADTEMKACPWLKELKREVVWLEVES